MVERVLIKSIALVCVMAATVISPTALAGDGEADSLASFDQVDAKGTNLRKILAEHPLIKSVLPFGARTTFIETEGDGALRSFVMNKDVEKAFNRLCRTKWQIKDVAYDMMSGKAAIGWRDLTVERLAESPWLIHTHVVINPETKAETRIDGSRCEGVFTWEAKTRNMNPTVHIVNFGYIRHETDQPHVWKSFDISEPTEFPADGIVPTVFFGEQYKDGLLTHGRYPSAVNLLAWSNRLCELRSGYLRMALQKTEYVAGRWQRKQIVHETLDMMLSDLPDNDYYLACEGTGRGFLIRKFKDADKRERLAFQRGRDLESVGVRP